MMTSGRPATWLINPQAVPAYVAVLSAAWFVALTAAFTDFSYDAATMNGTVLALMALVGLGAWLARRGYRIGSAFEAIALFTGLSFAAPFCAVILASLNVPLTDAILTDIDRYLLVGLEREDIILAVTRYPPVFDAVRFVYTSLLVQPWLLLVLLWATGREKRGWSFIAGWAIALCITLIVFAMVPAMGAPPYYLDYMDTLQHARDGSLRVLGTNVVTGIITFPSFHAAAAVLLAWGFAPIPRIGRLCVVWNALMLASAFFASHYLVDLVAGGLVGGVSIWAARFVLDRLTDSARNQAIPAGVPVTIRRG